MRTKVKRKHIEFQFKLQCVRTFLNWSMLDAWAERVSIGAIFSFAPLLFVAVVDAVAVIVYIDLKPGGLLVRVQYWCIASYIYIYYVRDIPQIRVVYLYLYIASSGFCLSIRFNDLLLGFTENSMHLHTHTQTYIYIRIWHAYTQPAFNHPSIQPLPLAVLYTTTHPPHDTESTCGSNHLYIIYEYLYPFFAISMFSDMLQANFFHFTNRLWMLWNCDDITNRRNSAQHTHTHSQRVQQKKRKKTVRGFMCHFIWFQIYMKNFSRASLTIRISCDDVDDDVEDDDGGGHDSNDDDVVLVVFDGVKSSKKKRPLMAFLAYEGR